MLQGIIPSLGLSAAATPATNYRVPRSLRFNSANANTYAGYVNVVNSDKRQIMTVSTWFKRIAINAIHYIYCGFVDANNYVGLYINTNGSMSLVVFIGGTLVVNKNFGNYTDLTKWFHICFSIDTTPATPTVTIEINSFPPGSYITNTNTLTQNTQLPCHVNGAAMWLGTYSGPTYLYCGYLAETHVLDGIKQPASAFAKQDAVQGWIPKAYLGLHGANGFFVNFGDNSSVAALGKDLSGMSNLLTYSDNFTIWSTVNSPTVTGGQPDLFGGTNAFKLAIGPRGNVSPAVTAIYTYSAGQQTTATVYAKTGTPGFNGLGLYNGWTQGAYAGFDLDAITINAPAFIIGNATNPAATIIDAGNGWRKCSVTVTHNTAGDDVVCLVGSVATTTPGNYITIFRADLTNGAIMPSELQLVTGTAVPNKNLPMQNFLLSTVYTNDSFVDVPFDTDTPTGKGEQNLLGYYMVMNPNDCYSMSFGWGNLYAGNPSATAQWGNARSTLNAIPLAKHWWCEFNVWALNSYTMFGTGDRRRVCRPILVRRKTPNLSATSLTDRFTSTVRLPRLSPRSPSAILSEFAYSTVVCISTNWSVGCGRCKFRRHRG